jgi:ATP-dependent DNA helicase Rep
MDNITRLCANDPIATIKEMIADSGYESWLYQNANSEVVAEKRMGNVWFLVEAIQQILDRTKEDATVEDATMEDAIARLLLREK